MKNKDSTVHCRLCGQHVLDIAKRGAYLKRVNPKGEDFIGECSPSCDRVHGNNEDAVINALEGK